MHHYIPSHVVDCQHSHNGLSNSSPDKHGHGARSRQNGHAGQAHEHTDEHSPLLPESGRHPRSKGVDRSMSATGQMPKNYNHPDRVNPLSRRPSLQTRVSKLVTGAKLACKGDGQCYGYSDPCAQECFKAISRNPAQANVRSRPFTASQPNLLRTATAPYSRTTQTPLHGLDEEDYFISPDSSATLISNNVPATATSRQQTSPQDPQNKHSQQNPDLESNSKHTPFSSTSPPTEDTPQQQHHHHVPTNAFLSIGLQTSIAIALHKLPEGFITYATNHANPKLGFAVFMALFIHNITEGFAMALPLYLAIGSRWKSMFWSSLLGGASQPFGAGVAALWFKVAGTSDRAPGETVYGCMFAITAGIMASVALQLFAESLALNHNRNICLTFAFVGMGILGVSFALTAG
ncbi:MAG: hypothetical protein Q9225_000570 [Loekoesia sp. 1 TL-2023]